MTLQRKVSILGFVALSFLSIYLVSTSTFFISEPNHLSRAITIDVLLTIPIIYFLLIRKTSIPKISVLPVTIAGVVLASFILPEEQQNILSLFKTWALPIIELFIASFIIYNVVKAIKSFKSKRVEDSDFYTVLKHTCYDILPKGAVIPFVTEISVFYYGFIYWKKRTLQPNEFTYHKESGSLTLLITFLFLIAIETLVFHLLLASWNTTVAWILTGLSIYTCIQIFGFVKSILKRPIILTKQTLLLRYGIMKETEIKLVDIDSIEISSKDIETNKDLQRLSLLGGLESHNTIIHLNKTNTISSLYGIKKGYKSIALSVDEVKRFKTEIENTKAKLTNL
ncbi:hypothetical protein [uncultured Winogradskyella sp.]|uniref:hypothetical protein n=1 Tax=uncultured Winogradskyella sp. TaxID=395353 RepID=UPI00262370F6|nr:hypothetical protein [uncultured Winogradskyella sp.]